MHTITFYSYKGGTGRSLAVANTAHFLAWLGRKVVVLDLDLEAPGLHYKFGLHEAPNRRKKPLQGLVDLLTSLKHDDAFPSLEPYVQRVCMDCSYEGEVWLMPAGDAPTRSYLRALRELQLPAFFDPMLSGNAPVAEGLETLPAALPLFLELKARIFDTFKADYLLIDARTGITEIGGAALQWIPDVVVCLMHEGEENQAGCRTVLRSVASACRIPDYEKPIEIIVALSRIQEESQAEEDKLLDHVKQLLEEQTEPSEFPMLVSPIVPLHADVALDAGEFVVFGKSTANESVLLRDYHRLWQRLPLDDVDGGIDADKREVMAFFAELGRESTIKKLLLARRRLTRDDLLKSINVKARISEREGAVPKIVKTEYFKDRLGYDAFITSVRQNLLERTTGVQHRQEVDVPADWDLLAERFRDGVVDFCEDMYYLTENRGRLVDIVQLGKCPGYLVCARAESRLYRDVEKCNGLDLPSGILKLKQKWCNLQIVIRGETPAASEANQLLSPRFIDLITRGSDKELWESMNQGADQIAIIDNVIFATRCRWDDTFGKAFQPAWKVAFQSPVPVGLAYPREDFAWRREISTAIAESLIALLHDRSSSFWENLTNDLRTKDGIELYSVATLCRSLLLDMPLDQVLPWRRKFMTIADIAFVSDRTRQDA